MRKIEHTQNLHCFPAITLLGPFFMSNHRRSAIRQIIDICWLASGAMLKTV
jgi:hypothetical protein